MCDHVRELRSVMGLRMALKVWLTVWLKFSRTACGVNYGNSKTAERGLALSISMSVVLGAGYA
ncbi:MAG: hypothetical protein NVS3B11_14270 [Collimonas sp.]